MKNLSSCHILLFSIIFAIAKRETPFMEKIIDENKQGTKLVLEEKKENTKKLFIESYGCAMNFSDSEIVASILNNQGYNTTQNLEEADLVLVNTCSIRDKAEQTIRKRLQKYNAVKRDINPSMKVGVLGCMAERLKEKFLEEEKIVDLVVGPDAYKDIPNLLNEVEEGRDAINVILSKEETYGDISPVRLNSNGINAFVSITRGCDNMCTFCVVPFTRGRERSRDWKSIIEECKDLFNNGYKEVTLLGQNVDSYYYTSSNPDEPVITFAKLLEKVAQISPDLLVRFSTSHPKDITDDVLHTMAKYENICKNIHLPVQSGSNKVLDLMNRKHTISDYYKIFDQLKEINPDIQFSSDFIIGYPGEEDEDFNDTFELIKKIKFINSYSFIFSPRPGTVAADLNLIDKKISMERLEKIQSQLYDNQMHMNKSLEHKTINVLVENLTEDKTGVFGRSEYMTSVIFNGKKDDIGKIVPVKINKSNRSTLFGERDFSSNQKVA